MAEIHCLEGGEERREEAVPRRPSAVNILCGPPKQVGAR